MDVRTIPRSQHNPQFNRDTLPKTLRHAAIGYTHMKELGGLRHARQDSSNAGALHVDRSLPPYGHSDG